MDGRSGSGKTEVAEAVADLLTAPVLHLDDFYPGWDGLAEGVQILRRDVLEPLSRGVEGGYRRWDWHTSAHAGWCPVPVTPILVVEGVGASLASGGLANLTVWVEAEEPVRRQRALARDGDVFAPHWQTWAMQELDLFGGVFGHADVVIDNNEEKH